MSTTMLQWTLFNLILYNFSQSKIRSAVFFNCWNREAASTFFEMTSQRLLFSQFVQIDQDRAVPGDYFRHSFFVHRHPAMGVFLDLNCQRSALITKMSSSALFFSQRYHWLIYDDRANRAHFQELFINANLSVDADVTYAMRIKEDASLSESLESTENYKKNSLGTSTEMFRVSSLSLDSSAAEMPAKNFGLSSPSSLSTSYATSFILYDVYNNGYRLGGTLNMTIDRLIACDRRSCRLQRHLSNLHTRSKYGNRVELADISLRVATVVSAMPLTTPAAELQKYLRSTNETLKDAIARHGFQLVLILQEMLNCNLSYRYVDRWSTGVFGGAVGELVHENVEVLSSPLLPVQQRLAYLRPIQDTTTFHSVCVFRTPRGGGLQTGAFLRGKQTGVFLEPFSGAVWGLFGAVLAIAAVMLWSTFHVERRLHQCVGCVPSLLATSLIAFGAACFQGSHLVPRSAGGRLAFFSLSLVTFLMYNYYTSLVVSSLLGSPVKSEIKTIDQLADSNAEVGILPLVYTMAFLNSSNRLDVQRFVRNKITSRRDPESVYVPAEEGLRRVRDQPGYVYVFEDSLGYAVIGRVYKPEEICDLNEVKLRTGKALYMHLHRNSSYTEIIKLKFMRMFETGILLKHRRYWNHEKLQCYGDNVLITVGLEYTAPLFLLLVCAYVVVTLLLIVEVACERYKDTLIARIKTMTKEAKGND